MYFLEGAQTRTGLCRFPGNAIDHLEQNTHRERSPRWGTSGLNARIWDSLKVSAVHIQDVGIFVTQCANFARTGFER